MNAEIKAKWLEALRSGRYPQGRKALRDEHDQYCCLGVLCDVVDPNAWEQRRGFWAHHGKDGYPTPSLVTQVGLTHHAASYLVSMNDAFLKTFKEIADYIERHA
jgi:hypothetical protein